MSVSSHRRVIETWRRVWGGRKFFFADRNFRMTYFREKNSISRPKILDDLPLPVFPVLYAAIYNNINKAMCTISDKNSFMTPFYSVCTFTRIQ